MSHITYQAQYTKRGSVTQCLIPDAPCVTESQLHGTTSPDLSETEEVTECLLGSSYQKDKTEILKEAQNVVGRSGTWILHNEPNGTEQGGCLYVCSKCTSVLIRMKLDLDYKAAAWNTTSPYLSLTSTI